MGVRPILKEPESNRRETYLAAEGFAGIAPRLHLLKPAPRFFTIDCSVFAPAGTQQFLDPECHGEPHIDFDRAGVLAVRPLDRATHAARFARRYHPIRAARPVPRTLADNGPARGPTLDAQPRRRPCNTTFTAHRALSASERGPLIAVW